MKVSDEFSPKKYTHQRSHKEERREEIIVQSPETNTNNIYSKRRSHLQHNPKAKIHLCDRMSES